MLIALISKIQSEYKAKNNIYIILIIKNKNTKHKLIFSIKKAF